MGLRLAILVVICLGHGMVHPIVFTSFLVQVHFCVTCLVWFGLVWFGLVWFGLVWFGLVWFGLVWFGLVWFGLVWFGLVWFVFALVWFGVVWFRSVWLAKEISTREPFHHALFSLPFRFHTL